MIINLSIEDLLRFLKETKHEAQLQKETGQIYILLKILNQDFPLFIRLMEGTNLLQLLIFIPAPFKAKVIDDMARFLHYLNKELDIPGFGMDENSNVVFYRLIIPAFDKKVDTTLLEAYLTSIQKVCEAFTPVIVTLAQGNTTFEEILYKLKQESKK